MSVTSSEPDHRLVSGEAVQLEVRVARVGSRALALMIDVVGQLVMLIILLPVAMLSMGVLAADAALASAVQVITVILVFVAYQTAWETLSGGRTPGKFVLGLRVVRDDGGPIRFRHAITRALVGATLEWPGLLLPVITWFASITTMLTNAQGKRLGDLAAGTIVIHDRTPMTWGWVPGIPPHLVPWASTLDLTALDDDLALACRHFLARSRSLSEPFRSRLGERLAGEVMALTTPRPPMGTPGWAYLAAVVGERHRRAATRLATARRAQATLWPELFPTPPPIPAPRAAAPLPLSLPAADPLNSR
ncbi:putative RDD family membrane protein YckC [Allocatelliglobosispora scoriae]|uniref:Putative RDD family membrane protein YckC n=1 Tax=Allocatelliglobosispora scoriae TaxID=643052 RepID=A0A841BPQ2_9ACTN|nr:RDD family protein [Allocatelliglobosispora scoriae]MBB5870244.1 putative RDD family membrane protein YckC [Allocatelliglobosispora scoriae]